MNYQQETTKVIRISNCLNLTPSEIQVFAKRHGSNKFDCFFHENET